MLPDLLPSRTCLIRLDIEIEHEAALRATDIDIEGRPPTTPCCSSKGSSTPKTPGLNTARVVKIAIHCCGCSD